MATKIKRSKATNAADLLLDVAEAILEEPMRYNQKVALMTGGPGESGAGGTYPDCGTIGCRAGWIVVLNKTPSETKRHQHRIVDVAAKILGMPVHDLQILFRASAVTGSPQTETHAREGARGLLAFRKQHLTRLKRKKV